MAKVTMPLGGASASGHVGDQLIFQGNTVKAYRKPRDPKTPAQTYNRDKLQSITKTILAMKAWARGCLQGMLGIGWYGLIYKEVLATWAESEIAYNQTWEGDKVFWENLAPYKSTRLEPGLVFYACYNALVGLCMVNGVNFFTDFSWLEGEAGTAKLFWDKENVSTFYPGIYDNTNAGFDYDVPGEYWSEVEDVNAYGGSFALSHVSSPSYAHFNFYGTKFGILYHQSLSYSAMSVSVDNRPVLVFSQNNAAGLYQVEWLSNVYHRGAHIVDFWRSGADGSVCIDGLVVYG